MNKVTAIHGLYNEHLQSLATAEKWPVRYQGGSYGAVSGPYLRAWVLPSESMAAWLGSGSPNKLRCIYQIDVVTGFGGWGPTAGIADKVATHFKKGQRLKNSDVSIRFLKVSLRPARADGAEYIQTIDVVTDILARED